MKIAQWLEQKIHEVWMWLCGEKALSFALLGFVLFIVSLLSRHANERLRFGVESLAMIAFACAIKCEKQMPARVVFGLFLVAIFLLTLLDFNMTAQLSQFRLEQSFDAP